MHYAEDDVLHLEITLQEVLLGYTLDIVSICDERDFQVGARLDGVRMVLCWASRIASGQMPTYRSPKVATTSGIVKVSSVLRRLSIGNTTP